MQLREINHHLHTTWGLSITLDADGAQSLKFVSDRGRFIRSLEAGPSDPDAKRYVRTALEAAGYDLGSLGDGADESDGPEARGRGEGSANAQSGSGRAGREGEAGSDHQDHIHQPSIHIYGQKAALTVEADRNRRGAPTIAVDAALARGGGGYDWNDKLRLQLTPNELVEFSAVLVGVLDSCEFKNRGDAGDKALAIKRQADNPGYPFFIRVIAQGQSPRAVPVTSSDAFWVVGLCLAQLRAVYPWMDQSDPISLLRAVY